MSSEPEPGSYSQSRPPAPRGPSPIWVVVVIAVLIGVGWFWITRRGLAANGGKGSAMRPEITNQAVPVIAGTVERKDVPIYLEGIGTAQAFNTVTVRSRVDGQVQRVAFVEGQDVHVGEVLAQIDPAPFQAQVDQNVAKKAQDEAQLNVAKLTLARDAELLAGKILSQQEYDTQKAQVEQLQAAANADQAVIDNARVQLNYCTITSPLEGRTGLRQVDQGNIVRANDPTGLVVITQLRPISVVFGLPQQYLPSIQEHLVAGEELSTFAVDEDNHRALSEGKLAVIDNQIDTTTGTLRLKANFPNQDLKLWPGQFVNVRLHLETRKAAPVVPASVVQHGPDGTFAFVITSELTAQVRPIKVELVQEGQALIASGLAAGERVVVDGQYKLQAGSKVKPQESGTTPPSGSPRPAVAKGTS